MRRILSTVILATLLSPAFLVGAEEGPAAPAKAPTIGVTTPDVSSFPSPTAAPLWRLGLAVGLVSAAGWAITVWARRRGIAKGGESARIEVMASRSIGPRHQVALLEVGEHRLLVGLGPDTITTLADLSLSPFGEELDQTMPTGEEQNRETLVNTIGRFEGLDA